MIMGDNVKTQKILECMRIGVFVRLLRRIRYATPVFGNMAIKLGFTLKRDHYM